MAKHPVPKKKQAKSSTSRRYKSFANGVKKRLADQLNLMDCPSCGEKTRAHHVCESCGKYRGEQIVNKAKATEKITKIKA